MLTPDYTAHADAGSGPLKIGDVGKIIQDDNDSKPFKVIFNGAEWFYAEGALRRAPSGSGASVPATAQTGRLQVGEAVVLVGEDEGCLRAGESGILIEDDGSGCPFRVRGPSGSTYWYNERDLKRPTVQSTVATAGTGRLLIGERVVLATGFEGCQDAGGGPLKPGDVGVVEADDRDSKPFKVRFNGKSWYYDDAALCRESDDRRAMGSTSVPTSTGRLRVGESVMLVGDDEGCLRVGESGTLVEDDGSGCPFKVRSASGNTYWYNERDLKRANAGSSASAAAPGDHAGEWRAASKRQWCSLADSPEGPVCSHARGIINAPHW